MGHPFFFSSFCPTCPRPIACPIVPPVPAVPSGPSVSGVPLSRWDSRVPTETFGNERYPSSKVAGHRLRSAAVDIVWCFGVLPSEQFVHTSEHFVRPGGKSREFSETNGNRRLPSSTNDIGRPENKNPVTGPQNNMCVFLCTFVLCRFAVTSSRKFVGNRRKFSEKIGNIGNFQFFQSFQFLRVWS